MIEESTFRRYITESWEWWKPIWKSDRNGFMRCKGEHVICKYDISSLRRRSSVIETGYRDHLLFPYPQSIIELVADIFRFRKIFFYLLRISS